MKSRQVGFVLIALIAVGVLGMVFRVVSAEPEEETLSGLLPITPDVIDQVVISSGEKEARLIKVGDNWRVGDQFAFEPKVAQFWAAVADISGAQLISINPANHQRMGVDDRNGTLVQFYLGPAIQEQFIIGKWSPDVRLCYVRQVGKEKVYGFPCAAPNIFDPDPDGWRNPVVYTIPRSQIESIEYRYPAQEFTLQREGTAWTLVTEDGQETEVDPFLMEGFLRSVEGLLASGFVPDEEARQLEFDAPDATVLVTPVEDSQFPRARLRFLKRDDLSYYVKNGSLPTVYIVSKDAADLLLRKAEDFLPPQE